MTKRSEPEILPDLIRLHSTLEADADALRRHEPPDSPLVRKKMEQAELIEESRAALHRLTVAAGKADLARASRSWTVGDVLLVIGFMFAAFCVGLIVG